MWRSACAAAITEGATSCLIVNLDSTTVIEGVDDGGLEGAPALVDVIARRTPLDNEFARSHGAPIAMVEELLVVGAEHAVFVAVDALRGLVFLIALSPTTSVALGWSILRRLASGGSST